MMIHTKADMYSFVWISFHLCEGYLKLIAPIPRDCQIKLWTILGLTNEMLNKKREYPPWCIVFAMTNL